MKYGSIFLWVVLYMGGMLSVWGQTDSLYRIERLSFSSIAYDEYAPVWLNARNQLIFVANRSAGGLFKHSTQKGTPLENYFYVTRRKDSAFTGSPRVFASELISGSNKGPMVFNREGTRMYLTKNIVEPGRFKNYLGTNNLLGIFESSFVGGRWTTPALIAVINVDGYNTCHPALSPDGKRMYFASDRPGGFGRMDLWYSDFVKGQWTEPKNMGPVINTSFNEVYPTCAPDGRLYFSSNRLDKTMGKFDIFYSELINGQWIEPRRIPEPFNSRYNDLCFVPEGNGDRGFFSSDRYDRTTSDVFYFYTTEPKFGSAEPLKVPRLCYTFFENNGVVIDTAIAVYEWTFSDGSKQRGLEAYHCFPGTGEYTVELNVVNKLEGTIDRNVVSYYFPVEKIEQPWIACPDTIKVNEWVEFSGSDSWFVSFVPEKYYWDFGDGSKAMGITVRYQYVRPGKYRVRLGVSGKEQGSGKFATRASYKEVVVEGDYTLTPSVSVSP
ncbi:MAG TPA: PKD domain-containing protein [Bacteroidales bacterium]|nr:PKD domain-containing protein [Bacteroidales bacterium]HQK36514.1 PKD domain-containing protein [Bacteroidales bacterium]